MNILILGGTGQISTPMTRQLLAQGHAVTHFNRGKRGAGFDGIPFSDDLKTIVGDRHDYPRFEAQMHEAGAFDCVIDMIGFLPAEIESAVRAFAGRCGQFIFCSTVDVYAHPHPTGGLPYRDDAPRNGLNSYAANKILCEDILTAAHARHALNVTTIRPSYTYAEGAGVLHSFGGKTTYVDRLRKGKPIIVHGDGQSLWCACHSEDVGRAFVNAVGNPKASGKAYHTTGSEFLTWNQHHRTVAAAIGAPEPTLIHIPTNVIDRLYPARDTANRAHWIVTNFQFNNIFDNTAAREDLGFVQTIPWSEGARRLVNWLEANGRVENSDLDPFDDQLIAAWRAASAAITISP